MSTTATPEDRRCCRPGCTWSRARPYVPRRAGDHTPACWAPTLRARRAESLPVSDSTDSARGPAAPVDRVQRPEAPWAQKAASVAACPAAIAAPAAAPLERAALDLGCFGRWTATVQQRTAGCSPGPGSRAVRMQVTAPARILRR